MANVQHSALTGSDLHEMKGAATAANNTVPISNGAGQTPFGFISYTDITNKPNIPQVFYNNVVVPNSKTHIVTGTATAGIFNINISALGLTTVYGAWVTALSGSTGLGNACSASIATITTAAITGTVVIHSGSTNTLGTTQTLQFVIRGV